MSHTPESILVLCKKLADSNIVRKKDMSKPTYKEFYHHAMSGGLDDIFKWRDQVIEMERKIRWQNSFR